MRQFLFLCLVASASALPSFGDLLQGVRQFSPFGGGYGTVSNDCVYSDWTQWSPCSGACETPGFSSRSRAILQEGGYGGQSCDTSALEEWRDCIGEICDRDCVMSDWASWGSCDAACGPGNRHRSRGVLSDAVGSGAGCGFRDEVEECNNGGCAQDCQMSDWAAWSRCNADCGVGQRDRSRFVVQDAFGGGFPCGESEQWENCDNGPCREPCTIGDWSSWSACPACGDGSRSRSRSVNVFNDCIQPDTSFLSLSETEQCPFLACAVDCQMTQWSAWSRCDADCGQGSRDRSRQILVQAQNGGFPCGETEQWDQCNNGPCREPCTIGQWSSWSSCPACGPGSRSRSRSVNVFNNCIQPDNSFLSLSESEACPFISCAVDCQMTQWSAWSRCDADCGSGRQDRNRQILVPAQNGGRQCGELEQWQNCNNGPCREPCTIGQWSSWSSCPSCGQASRSRFRSVNVFNNCIQPDTSFLSLTESEQCPFISCAVDCRMSQWSSWSRCDADCGQGQQDRSRQILVQAQNGGRQCEDLEQWQNCNNGPCRSPCTIGDWSSWSSCPSCGQASRSRSRSVNVFNNCIQPDTSFLSLTESEQCPFISCAVDCEMSQWSAWSRCDADCGQGRQDRSRFVTKQAQNGGRQCGQLEEWQSCNAGPCAVDCRYSFWSAWSGCPACGQADQTRTRTIVQQGANGGVLCDFSALSQTTSCNNLPCRSPCTIGDWSSWSSCPSCGQASRSRARSVNVVNNCIQPDTSFLSLTESEQCPFVSCAVDCRMTQWSSWRQCDANCGSGRQDRRRSVIVPASNGGRQCGQSEEWQNCNNGPCAEPCGLSQWSAWSGCPKCGPGSQSRNRNIQRDGFCIETGFSAFDLSETEQCQFVPCAVHCEMSQWSAWSRCDADCGQGRQDRSRFVVKQAQNGGRQCGNTEEWQSCSNGQCQPCGFSQWSAWSGCPRRGPGSQSRNRQIQRDGSCIATGFSAFDLSETEQCQNLPCDVDCRMSAWSAWSRCDADCGTGRQDRSRFVVQQAVANGRRCGQTEEWQSCNAGECVRECQVGAWSAWSTCSSDCPATQGTRSRSRAIVDQGNTQCPSTSEQETCYGTATHTSSGYGAPAPVPRNPRFNKVINLANRLRQQNPVRPRVVQNPAPAFLPTFRPSNPALSKFAVPSNPANRVPRLTYG